MRARLTLISPCYGGCNASSASSPRRSRSPNGQSPTRSIELGSVGLKSSSPRFQGLCDLAFLPTSDVSDDLRKSLYSSSVEPMTRYHNQQDSIYSDRTTMGGRIALGSRSTRQPGIKMLGKCIAVCQGQRRRTAPDIAAGSHRVHKISHTEYSTDRIG